MPSDSVVRNASSAIIGADEQHQPRERARDMPKPAAGDADTRLFNWIAWTAAVVAGIGTGVYFLTTAGIVGGLVWIVPLALGAVKWWRRFNSEG